VLKQQPTPIVSPPAPAAVQRSNLPKAAVLKFPYYPSRNVRSKFVLKVSENPQPAQSDKIPIPPIQIFAKIKMVATLLKELQF
jgi:hypothetical protein